MKCNGETPEELALRLKAVERTCLGPLHARARETLRPDGIIHDWKSVEIAGQVEFDAEDINWPLYQLQIAIRTQIIDEMALSWMVQNPAATIFNLGAGLDTRFHRLDNGMITWHELDLCDVISLRRWFFTEHQRYRFMSGSVTEHDWLRDLLPDDPHLFIIEGLANYLEEHEVRTLYTAIVSALPRAEIVTDTLGLLYVRMSRDPAYKWGMSADSRPDRWDSRIEILDSSCIFDRHPDRWREFPWLVPLMAFRKNAQITLHLRRRQ
jgi:O-methyltransferase involved in polyketide biosynthesis